MPGARPALRRLPGGRRDAYARRSIDRRGSEPAIREETMKDLIHYGDGVHTIDSGYGRPQLAAIHVIVQDGRAAVVDTASNASVPRILGALAALGIAPGGGLGAADPHPPRPCRGAGSLMCALPQARAAACIRAACAT